MPQYRRWRKQGGCVFLTVVTQSRRRLFTCFESRGRLRDAMTAERNVRPFRIEAMVLLPDHWHALWTLPEEDADYSGRVSRIKREFTRAHLASGGPEAARTDRQKRTRRRGIWQDRFWEHTIRDARDFKMHLDYIHMNPVKHGLVDRAIDWEFSTFSKWVRKGEYETDWAGRAELSGNVEYYWAG